MNGFPGYPGKVFTKNDSRSWIEMGIDQPFLYYPREYSLCLVSLESPGVVSLLESCRSSSIEVTSKSGQISIVLPVIWWSARASSRQKVTMVSFSVRITNYAPCAGCRYFEMDLQLTKSIKSLKQPQPYQVVS